MNIKDLILKSSELKIKLAKERVPSDFSYRLINNLNIENRVIIGPRRLGKTTFLYKIANQNKEQVLFVDFSSSKFVEFDFNTNSENSNLFKKNLVEIIESNLFKYILIDEIQILNNWSRFLKSLIDDNPNIIFIATGSDAESLNNSGESGAGRFKINFMGPITFYEFKAINKNATFDEYINFGSFPKTIQKDLDMKYQMIYEKQFMNKRFKPLAVSNILRILSLNPGSKINRNNLVKQIRETSDSKVDSKQVLNIINYLIDSQLLLSIKDKSTNVRAKRENAYTLYPTDWLTYLHFEEIFYTNLNKKTLPKPGFVFENMIISNINSFSNTPNKRNKIFNKIDKPDIDLIFNSASYEIKSIDVLKSERKHEYLNKAINLGTTIIHKGKTKKVEINKLQSVFLINVEDFLLSDQLKKIYLK